MSVSSPLVLFAETQCLIQDQVWNSVLQSLLEVTLHNIHTPLQWLWWFFSFFRCITSDPYLKNWIFCDKMFISITIKELTRMCNSETFFLSFIEISEYQKIRRYVYHNLVSSEYVPAYSLNSSLAPHHNVFCRQFRINFPTSSYKSSFEVVYLYPSPIMALRIQMSADE